MSLHVRVCVGFFTSRKTMRLRAKIGDAALWVPVRLWTYAAANQPDGVFKDYSAQELAFALEYQGDAKALLEALLEAGFLDPDPLQIHQWEEHNGYHVKYKERASCAAKARWEKHKAKKEAGGGDTAVQAKDKKGKEASIASSTAQALLNASNPLVGIESAIEYLTDSELEPQPNPPYTKDEVRMAWTACNAAGWMWGSRITSDPMSFIATKIDDNRRRPGATTPGRRNGPNI